MRQNSRTKLFRLETALLVTLTLITSVFAFQNCAEKGLDKSNNNSSNEVPPTNNPLPPGPTVNKSQVWNIPGQVTFVAPPTAKFFKLTMVGGGGGGGPGIWSGGYISNCSGGEFGTAYSGTGGGSGSAFNNKDIPVRGGQVLKITVGSGGVAACDGGRAGGASLVTLESNSAGEIGTTYSAGGGGGGVLCHGCGSPVGAAGTGGDIPGASGKGGVTNCSGPALGGASPLGALGGAGGNSNCGGRGNGGANGYVKLEWSETGP